MERDLESSASDEANFDAMFSGGDAIEQAGKEALSEAEREDAELAEGNAMGHEDGHGDCDGHAMMRHCVVSVEQLDLLQKLIF
ncbi:hypothetical protein SO802_024066 [Lithocarpus litseifolius]|uniref:Uncharacterized protein n=1 Tax=Lithocarpus litseifolius TaxID=425828 RepID=A0AAW2C9H4_9ROSI